MDEYINNDISVDEIENTEKDNSILYLQFYGRLQRTVFLNSRQCNWTISRYNMFISSMKAIWKQKIDAIDEIIANTEIVKDGRLIQLYKKRDLLEQAFCNCK